MKQCYTESRECQHLSWSNATLNHGRMTESIMKQFYTESRWDIRIHHETVLHWITMWYQNPSWSNPTRNHDKLPNPPWSKGIVHLIKIEHQNPPWSNDTVNPDILPESAMTLSDATHKKDRTLNSTMKQCYNVIQDTIMWWSNVA